MGLGAGGLDAARSLGKKGIEVYGIYTSNKEVGRFSRYCKAILFPPLKSNDKLFLEKIIELTKNFKRRAVLLPAHDEYINFISKYREVLSQYYLFMIPDGDFIEKLVNKSFMVQLAIKHGLLIPQTFFCNRNDKIEEIAQQVKYPCIIKPLNSFSIQFPGKNIIVNDRKSFVDLFQNNPSFISNTLVQEIIEGGDDSLCQFQAYLNNNSQPLSIRSSRKLRQFPPNTGVGSYMITEELPEVRKLSISFLKKINYKGFAGLEFKRDLKTNTYYFIEINPRIPWGHALCTDCGNSLALSAYLDLTGNYISTNEVVNQINGIRWIGFGLDLGSFAHKFSRHEITFTKWASSVLKANSFAFWDVQDPIPLIIAAWKLLGAILNSFMRLFHSGTIFRLRRNSMPEYNKDNK